jgi:hypothetical protein
METAQRKVPIIAVFGSTREDTLELAEFRISNRQATGHLADWREERQQEE